MPLQHNFSCGVSIIPSEGCTVSRSVYEAQNFGITYFSMSHDTDISPETFPFRKIILTVSGRLTVNISGHEVAMCDIKNIPAGMKTSTGFLSIQHRAKR